MIFAMGTGILYAITLMIVMNRIGMRKFMGYPALLDGVVVWLLGMLLHGTLGGLTAAISGGLFFSIAITVVRKYFGYSRYSLRHRKWVTTEGSISQLFIKEESSCRFNLKLLKLWPLFMLGSLIVLSAVL